MSILQTAHPSSQRVLTRRRRRGHQPDGRFRVPTTTVAATPGRVVDQRQALALLLAANPHRRADSRRTWDAIVTAMVHLIDWRTGAITGTHAATGAKAGAECERASYSHDTVGRVVAAAIAAGVLVCPAGLGGRSRRATGTGRNQCPTYFVIDPGLAEAELRTPPSHVSETDQLGETHSFREDPIFPKFANFDPTVVPATVAERRQAAEWLRSELHLGIIANRSVVAMMAEHFRAGRSPARIRHAICRRPGDAHRPPLPTGGAALAAALAESRHATPARMLLGIIGYRLRQWPWTSAQPVRARRRQVPQAPPTAPAAGRSPAQRMRMLADIDAGRRRLRHRELALRDPATLPTISAPAAGRISLGLGLRAGALR